MSRKDKRHGRTGTLRGVGDVRRFLRGNDSPVWFVSPTAFELLGIDRWVRRFRYISAVDPFAGRHPHLTAPRLEPSAELESTTAVCNQLLAHPDVVTRLRSRGGIVIPLSADDETARLVRDAGLELASSTAVVRGTGELAAVAGVPEVPHVRGRASSYGVLQALAVSSGLGRDLVVRSGRTTVVVGSEQEWLEHAQDLSGRELEVMKRIRSRTALAVGVVTRHGTLVGPDLAEPSADGNGQTTCVLPDKQRGQIRRVVQLLGEHLGREGYRGWFEVELVVEGDGDAVLLGGLQPRFTNAGSLANVAAVARGHTPLFLFHLLEFLEVDYQIDVDALNARYADEDAADIWGWLTVRDNASGEGRVAAAPRSGVWSVDAEAHGGIRLLRRETDWRTVRDESEAFFLRIARKGRRRSPGSALGVVVARGRPHDDDRAQVWIDGITDQYRDAVPAGV